MPYFCAGDSRKANIRVGNNLIKHAMKTFFLSIVLVGISSISSFARVVVESDIITDFGNGCYYVHSSVINIDDNTGQRNFIVSVNHFMGNCKDNPIPEFNGGGNSGNDDLPVAVTPKGKKKKIFSKYSGVESKVMASGNQAIIEWEARKPHVKNLIVSPNPVKNNRIKINFEAKEARMLTVKIQSVMGTMEYEESMTCVDGDNYFEMNIPSTLQGNCVVSISSDTQVKSKGVYVE